MKRRDFITRSSILGAGSVLLPSYIWNAEKHLSSTSGKRVIFVQLSGGNDGLNTIVPYRNEIYYESRPKLAIPREKCSKISDEVGFSPAMKACKELFDQGEMTIIQNVGYPNPNKSHFRSMDIWHSASDSDKVWSTGWLGRYLDHHCAGSELNVDALQINDLLSLILKGENKSGLALSSTEKLRRSFQNCNFRTEENIKEAKSNLQFLYKTFGDTSDSVDYLYNTQKKHHSSYSFPQHKFGKNLQMISRLIIGGASTKIYYSGLGGFDTHARQAGHHAGLLETYSSGLKSLRDELKKHNEWNNTLVVTFSEFGRKIKENASHGTDHGTGNCLFLAGGALKSPGLYNELQSLAEHDLGGIQHSIDFRTIYAAVLEKWLEVDQEPILGQRFTSLPIL